MANSFRFRGNIWNHKYYLFVSEKLDFIYLVRINSKNIACILMYEIGYAGIDYTDMWIVLCGKVLLVGGPPVIHELTSDVINRV
jgi:hypothetical protein